MYRVTVVSSVYGMLACEVHSGLSIVTGPERVQIVQKSLEMRPFQKNFASGGAARRGGQMRFSQNRVILLHLLGSGVMAGGSGSVRSGSSRLSRILTHGQTL